MHGGLKAQRFINNDRPVVLHTYILVAIDQIATMAADRGVYSTSTAQEGQDLRRRNISSYDSTNGGLTSAYEENDDKKTKQVYPSLSSIHLGGQF